MTTIHSYIETYNRLSTQNTVVAQHFRSIQDPKGPTITRYKQKKQAIEKKIEATLIAIREELSPFLSEGLSIEGICERISSPGKEQEEALCKFLKEHQSSFQ